MTKASKIERSVAIQRSKLHPNPWNPNKTKPRQQAAIAESLAAYGQVLELVVRPQLTTKMRYDVYQGFGASKSPLVTPVSIIDNRYLL